MRELKSRMKIEIIKEKNKGKIKILVLTNYLFCDINN